MGNLTSAIKKKLNSVPLHELIPGLEGSGMTLHGKCPRCGKSGKLKGKWQGLYVTDDEVKNKRYVGCNSCGWKTGGGSINVMMEFHQVKFMDACQLIAKEKGIELEFEKDDEKSVSRRQSGRQAIVNQRSEEQEISNEKSFWFRQLESSGLSPEDVMAKVYVDDELTTISPFRKGSMDPYTGRIDNYADEMLILYFDLNGRRKMYIPKKNKTREMPYTRVRWSNPENHQGKNGKPIKYQTPAGAKTELYIPQVVRSLYQTKTQFDTLFVQEGEKKAEKACKHGIPSIAMQGISNIGNKEEGLPAELQYLVQQCGVRNIVFLMDADWGDLSSGLMENDYVDSRPRSFALATIKFRKYVNTLAQCGIYVDIWHAHINSTENGDKGIDDLLCNTLSGREGELLSDIEDAMLSHDGKGTYMDIINISSWSDTKIMTLWDLGNKDDFFSRHRKELLNLKTFQFGNVQYRNVNGNFEVSGCGGKFWNKWTDDKGKVHVEMDLIYLKAFLVGNGFRSRKTEDGRRAFVKIDKGVINHRDEFDIRQYVLNYVNNATKDHEVQLFFAESIVARLSVGNLCQLDLLETTAGHTEQYRQRFFLKIQKSLSRMPG